MKLRGRWHKPSLVSVVLRYSMDKRVRPMEDRRWIRDRRRRFKLEEDTVSEVDWLYRRRATPGWHNGAKTRNWKP